MIQKHLRTSTEFVTTVKDTTTQVPTTIEPITREPTTREPTTRESTTRKPTTRELTTREPTTSEPTTQKRGTTQPPTRKQLTSDWKVTTTTEKIATTERLTTLPATSTPGFTTLEETSTTGSVTRETARIPPTTAEVEVKVVTTEGGITSIQVTTTEKFRTTTKKVTTQASTTQEPTTQAPATQAPTTQAPSTQAPTTVVLDVTPVATTIHPMCQSLPYTCPSNSRCEFDETRGKPACLCDPGYRGTRTGCVDYDECQYKAINTICVGFGQVCENTIGAFKCVDPADPCDVIVCAEGVCENQHGIATLWLVFDIVYVFCLNSSF